LIAVASGKTGLLGNWKKLTKNDRIHSPRMMKYDTSQMTTRLLFSWRENTELQRRNIRESCLFGAGFEKKATVITTMPVSRFKF
jgi:hypothetical protein